MGFLQLLFRELVRELQPFVIIKCLIYYRSYFFFLIILILLLKSKFLIKIYIFLKYFDFSFSHKCESEKNNLFYFFFYNFYYSFFYFIFYLAILLNYL